MFTEQLNIASLCCPTAFLQCLFIVTVILCTNKWWWR